MVELENKVNSLYGRQFSQDVTDAVMNRIVMVHDGTRELNPMEYQDQYLLLRNTTFHNEIQMPHKFDKFD